MQAAIAAVTSIFSSIGSAVGVTGLGGAAAGVGLLSSAVSTIGGIQAANYQAAVSKREALIREQNAQRLLEAGRAEAQQQDQAAAAQIADVISTQAASGFALTSSSFVRRRNRLQDLAGRDRAAIIEDSTLQAKSEREAAAASLTEAGQHKRSTLFTLLAGGIGAADSIIGGANLTSSIQSRRVTNTARTIV